MRISGNSLAGAYVCTAVLAACGGSNGFFSSAPKSAAPPLMDTRDATLQTASGTTHPASSGGDLLYVASVTTLFVFSYPHVKFLDEISLPEGGGGQVCSASNGDIFVPVSNPQPEILEYAHGGTQPIATLESPAGTSPFACSIDPKTGNLAVTSLPSSHGIVEVYQGAQGTPKLYRDRGFVLFFYCSYDDSGDLFVTGLGSYGLAELPSGSSKFTNITLNDKHVGGQGVQWDGKYVTLTKFDTNAIYRIKIQGTTGKIVGVTHLDHAIERSTTNQYWIQGGIIIRPTGRWSRNLGLWDYPVSGSPLKIINKHFGAAGIFSATVSAGSS